jgi:hypothetical protein
MTENLNDEYYRGDIEYVPSPGAAVYLRIRNGDAAYPITGREVKILQSLRGCRSIEDHVRHLTRGEIPAINDTAGGGSPEEIATLLRRWVAQGVLRSRTLLQPGPGTDYPGSGYGDRRPTGSAEKVA